MMYASVSYILLNVSLVLKCVVRLLVSYSQSEVTIVAVILKRIKLIKMII